MVQWRYGRPGWARTIRRAPPRGRRGLRLERLEVRALLAADVAWSSAISFDLLTSLNDEGKLGVEPSHVYYADGQPQPMVLLSDRLAVPRPAGVTAPQHFDQLRQWGLTPLQPLNDTFSLFAAQQPIDAALITALSQSLASHQIVPVFGMLGSQTEAVLLNEAIVALAEGVEAESYFSEPQFAEYRLLEGTLDQFVVSLAGLYGDQALPLINQLDQDPRVAWAAPNFYQAWKQMAYFPNDPRLGNQWHLHNVGQGGSLVDADSNLPEAWSYFQPGGPPPIVIGVVDDGVATDHPDLLNWINVGESGGDGLDNDGNGWIDDVYGWNFVDNNNLSHPTTSTDNHGTAVAGVAAARGDNGVGVVGAAYNSPVLSARIFRGNAVASDANIAAAIYYASGRTRDGLGTWSAADIVNHSWGGGAPSTAITNAILWATTQARGGLGVPQFFAAGNSYGSVIYPASLSLTVPGVIAVGAMNNLGEKSIYSSYGPAVDIVAPSNDTRAGYLAIDTTDRVGSAGYSTGNYTGTGATGFGGTSSATPLATGIGALALARAQQLSIPLTAAQLKSLMRNNTKLAGSTAYDPLTGRNDLMGYGLIDAEQLLRGIGRAQISVSSDSQVASGGSTLQLAETVVGDQLDVRLRIRNQGTQPLELSGLSVLGAEFSIVDPPAAMLLGLGESTSFVVRFSPHSPGAKLATVQISSNDDQTPLLQFSLAASGKQATVSGYYFEDRLGVGVLLQPWQVTLADQQVFVDLNDNGSYDPLLQTGTLTQSTPAAIVDFQTTTSSLTVSGWNSWISDVKVGVNLTHPYVSDLIITLVAPDGNRVELFNRRGGSGDNLTGTLFDDAATTSIDSGTAPYSGSFRPEQPLAALLGLDPNGQWKLEISDNAPSSQGTLLNWSLQLVGGEPVTRTDAQGYYFFVDLPNGSYQVVAPVPNGWTASSPTQYAFTVTGPADSFPNRNFGMGKNDRFYAYVYDDLNGNGQYDDGEPPRAGRTLFLDGNSNGVLDGIAEHSFVSTPNAPIPDNTTIELPLNIGGVSGWIEDVNVSVNLNHTWVSDLRLWLVAPNGTEVLLFNRRGGSGKNLLGTTFDDQAAVPISAGAAPFSGAYRPEQPLSALLGANPNGTWKLRVGDFATLDVGTLVSWNLQLQTASDIAFVTDSMGWAQIDLPPGTHDLVLTDVGWNFTQPANGLYTVSAIGEPLYVNLYGERQAPPTTIVGASVNHRGWSGPGWAIDASKVLAQEGSEPQTLGYQNLINTTRGINALIFDFDDLPGSLTAADFVFQVSPVGAFVELDHPPEFWQAAPAPSAISLTPGEIDRVLVEWPDQAIMNRWLRITVLATEQTGLAAPQIYYLGHLLGEMNGPQGGLFSITNSDISLIRDQIGQNVSVSNTADLDKNGMVSNTDLSAMRGGVGVLQLRNITIAAVAGGGGPTTLGVPMANVELASLLAAPLIAALGIDLASPRNPLSERPLSGPGDNNLLHDPPAAEPRRLPSLRTALVQSPTPLMDRPGSSAATKAAALLSEAARLQRLDDFFADL